MPLENILPKTKISVILPFRNESDMVGALFARLLPVLEGLDAAFEIVCVDDGSTDDTFAQLLQARQADLRVKIVRFARNFGKEAALTCGLQKASGDLAVTMDSDLQHPPELIPEMYGHWKDGAKTVYAIRQSRSTDGWARAFLSKTFYVVFRHVADIQLPEGAGDFRLLDRAVIDAVNALPERNRFMKGLMTWVGFEYALVPFEPNARRTGRSKWSLLDLTRFAFDGLTSFSTVPLRIWTFIGFLISLFAFGYGGFLVARTALLGVDVPGFASLMTSILFLGGLQMCGLGVIGEYLARVMTEVKARPIYWIADQKGFDR